MLYLAFVAVFSTQVRDWSINKVTRRNSNVSSHHLKFSPLLHSFTNVYHKATEYSDKTTHVSKDVYMCFIDYNKAFDKVRHDQLMKVFQGKHFCYNDLKIISNLYYNQNVQIYIENNYQKKFKLEFKRGGRFVVNIVQCILRKNY